MNRKKPAIFALITLLVVLAVAITWAFWKGKLLPQQVGITKGVAVLPFEAHMHPRSGFLRPNAPLARPNLGEEVGNASY
jgi:hypothetical protein